MEETEKVQEILDEINQRKQKNYHKMEIEEISQELRNVMQFEQKISQRVEELEKKGIKSDLTEYVKMVCRNTTEREISEIQEIYLTKIDKMYLNQSK